MKLPYHKFPTDVIDWNDYIDLLEEKYKFQHRGFYETDGRKVLGELREKWMIDTGFKRFEYCLSLPEGSTSDWDRSSPEIAKRIEINNALNEYKKSDEYLNIECQFPYVDYWHYVLGCFPEITNGSMFYHSRCGYSIGDFINVREREKTYKYNNSQLETFKRRAWEAITYIDGLVFDNATEALDDDTLTFWVSW